MNEPKRYRLAVVNSHPIQYFAPLYRYLCRDPEIEVTALYCSNFSLRGERDPGFKTTVTWDVNLLDGYPHVFLGEGARRRIPSGFFSLVCPEIWRTIRTGGFDAVWLHGYSYAADLLAFVAAKMSNIPVFMRSETHLGLQRSNWRRAVRDGVLRIAYRFVDGFLAIGTANREYYLSLGVPPERIFNVPYTVDNDRFIEAARLARKDRDKVRERFGLPVDGIVVLYASKFMRRKHPDDLVRAVDQLAKEGLPVTLFMVGTGELEGELRELCQRLPLPTVVFGGFVNQADLPMVYAASDVFVLPSENEPWGLIVNEVMCAGVPVVVSDEVGCVRDLVRHGVNGALSKAGNVASLARALRFVLADDETRKGMGLASLEMIRGWSYEICLHGIRAALMSRTSSAR